MQLWDDSTHPLNPGSAQWLLQLCSFQPEHSEQLPAPLPPSGGIKGRLLARLWGFYCVSIKAVKNLPFVAASGSDKYS